MTTDTIAAAARILVPAIRSGAKVDVFPQELAPRSLAEAYAIQEAILATLGPAGAWKVSPAQPDAPPKTSPIPKSLVRASPADLGDLAADGEIEVEIGVLIGRDLSPGAPSQAEVEAAIGGAMTAIEVLRSRFADRRSVAPDLAMADIQTCGAVVFGPLLADWRGLDFATGDVWISVNGERAGAPRPNLPDRDNMLAALTWLAAEASRRGRGLKAGDIVITGARLKIDDVPAGATLEAGVGGLAPAQARLP